MGGRMVDRYGRRVEVILRDLGHGPQPWIRVSWHHHILVGAGYYRRVEDVLQLVDVESLVEVIALPVRPQETAVSDLDSAQVWADAITLDMERTGYTAEKLVALGAEHGNLAGVTLDLDHPETDLARCVVASHAGWVVGYDPGTDAWTAR